MRDNPDERRFELRDGDRLVGVLDYIERGGSLLLTHAEVEPALRGQGHGERLVEGALAQLEERGQEYTPLCPFVVAYLRRRAA